MSPNHNEVKFVFYFTNKDGIKKPIYFGEPSEIISVTDINQVLPAIEKVQDAVKFGYYAAGYISYEAASAFDKANKTNNGPKMPLLWFGLFQKPLEVPSVNHIDFDVSDWTPSITYDEYQHNINKIKEAIRSGETYQINYTFKMRAIFKGDPFSYFQYLLSKQNGSYSAFLDIGEYKIISVSPELFFRWDKSHIVTKPMKGTLKRGKYFHEDQENEKWLQNSVKNQAENLMIVDLLRNDLGRISRPQSIKVTKLFEIEKYPTVFQMTSTIEAMTRQDIELIDILQSLFPCGSITGAPKTNTMKYIQNLEKEPRGVYCGTIGLISPEDGAIFNIAIRTAVIDRDSGEIEYGVGGGITWDSTSDDEYSEALTKASLLKGSFHNNFELLETLCLENSVYKYLNQHAERLLSSAQYFSFKVNKSEVHKKLRGISNKHKIGTFRVRLLVSNVGIISTEIYPLDLLNKQLTFSIAMEHVNSDDIFLYHKTTNRSIYEKHKKNLETDEVLLWNEKKQITEFTTGNVVVCINAELFTPPQECGLLAGILRGHLLEEGIIKEKVMYLEDLINATEIFHLNSVRGMRSILLTNTSKDVYLYK